MPRGNFWETVTRYEAGKVLPWLALRNALGVTIPLAAGAALGDAGGGLVMGIGALNVSYSDGTDPYGHRARRMAIASVCCSLAVFAGAISGQSHAMAILGAALCAFVTGMMVAVNQSAADIGSITLITFVVFSAQQMSPKRALIAGSLALAGGLLQMLFALALWPVRRYGPERRVLAHLYTELASMAAAGAPATEAPPATAAISTAQTALATLGGDRSLEAERYVALLSQAERIRLGLVILSRLRARIGREPEIAGEAELVGKAMSLAGEVLAALGDGLSTGQPASVQADRENELRQLGEQLRGRPGQSMLRDARRQIEALGGQLRAALDLVSRVTPDGATQFEKREATHPWHLRLAAPLAVMRANLRLESAAFRHAVRLTVCVVVGTMVGQALGWRRSYWLPMTVAIVLKPDFTATFTRGVLRLAGTLFGLALATGLFHLLSPGMAAKVVLIGVFAFVLRCFGPANYGILVTALTALVVFMLALEGLAPASVMAARGINTTAGGLIALAAYWLWPTWERRQAPEILAAMFESYRTYFGAISRAYLAAGQGPTAEVEAARVTSRLARSNVEASAGRLRSEPGVPREKLAVFERMLANSHRFIHAVMSLEAGLLQSRTVPARPEFRVLSIHVDLTLYYLAARLRGSKIAPTDLPDLREDHHALVHAGDPAVERYALVNVETDRVTNSLNTLAEEVFEWTQE